MPGVEFWATGFLLVPVQEKCNPRPHEHLYTDAHGVAHSSPKVETSHMRISTRRRNTWSAHTVERR